jgi:hypothetical protein
MVELIRCKSFIFLIFGQMYQTISYLRIIIFLKRSVRFLDH